MDPQQTPRIDNYPSAPYQYFPATDLKQDLAAHSDEQLKLFLESWENLPVDAYMKDGADYRRRRYGSFHFSDGELVADPPGAFHQTEQINSLHGGIDRHFPPLTESTLEAGVLQSLIRFFMKRLPGEFDPTTSGVGVHQIRITATRDAKGLPAPEGVHEDGHHYVAQVLMRRTDVDGGESQLFDRDHQPLYRTTLLDEFEAVVIDDRRVFHGVSAIRPAAGVRQGVRDMLLIDYFPLQGRDAGA
ncbi:2OG-Fe dioxygenase family protein [Streptomyces halobius]|uniref:2OG-Fe dioxygenase family protein n=1 Tax=Streptomyces halobius TaxID=2879846 RepID=A0ABY4M9A3_9ACTN|nr:2OG-Fe dioxygenase family protein [Streptomyces halobius]UQA93718.1 2OG-Fe dioxygenase family protein [Streptomyces halobius]